MTAFEVFNALDNREVSRKEVEAVLEQAKTENNTAIIYRLSRVLNDSPEATHFEITITQYDSPTGLSGVQHTGDYREALDDCGRLRKGWKFVKGNVVRIEKKEKPKKDTQPKKEEPKEKKAPSKRLQILEDSLRKKEEKFNEKLSELYSDVKSANGQPLNDKRNGKSTMTRWDKKDNALRTLNKEIEKTKEALEREQFKINRVETVNEFIPSPILELVKKGVLNQWRKHPDRFFVEGVEK